MEPLVITTQTPCCRRRIYLRVDPRDLQSHHGRSCRACGLDWTFVAETELSAEGDTLTYSVLAHPGRLDEYDALVPARSTRDGWVDCLAAF